MPSSVGRQNPSLSTESSNACEPLEPLAAPACPSEPSGPENRVLLHPAAARSDSALGQAEAALEQNLGNWATGDHALAARALDALVSVPKPQLEAALEALDNKGMLQRFFDKASPDQRDALLELAVGAGFLKVRSAPAQPASAPGIPSPPARPALPINSDRLPTSMQDAVQASSRDAIRGYARDFNAYAAQYAAAASAARTGSDLRDLGPPAAPLRPVPQAEIGFSRERKFRIEVERAGPDEAPSTKVMTDAVSARRLQLIDEMKGGSGFLDVQVTKKAKLGDTHIKGAEVGVEVVGEEHLILAAGRRPELHQKVGAELEVGPAKLEVLRDAHGGVSAKVGFSGAAISVDANAVQFEVGKAYAWVEPQQGRMAVGISAGDVKVGVGVVGLSVEKAVEAFGRDFYLFDRRPEGLAQGTPWSKLSDEVRAKLERFDWNADEWARRQAALK